MTDIETINPPAELTTDVQGMVAWANALVIRNHDDYVDTSEKLKQTKTIRSRIADFFKPMKQKLDATKKAMLDGEKQLDGPLATVESIAKGKLLDYDREQERIRLEEQQRLQRIADEEARKKREIEEKAAAKQREIEAEERRKAEEKRKAAEAEADEAKRKKLLAEAAKAEVKANTASERADDKAAQAASIVAPTVEVTREAPKVAGQSIRKTWKAEILDVEKVIRWAVANNRLDLLTVNDKMLQGIATGLKERAAVDGVRFFEHSTLASGRA